MKDYEAFGQHLRQIKKRTGQTSSDLAKALGVDITYISKLENGREKPSAEVLSRIANHFSLAPEEAAALWSEAGQGPGLVVGGRAPNSVTPGTPFALPAGVAPMNPFGQLQPMIANPQTQVMGPQPAGTNVNINIDPVRVPVIYSDSVFVYSNDVGLVLDFAQGVGPTPQQVVQARVGMSKEHARRLLDALKANLGIE